MRLAGKAQSDPRRPERVHVARRGAHAARLSGAETEGGTHGEGKEAEQLCEGQSEPDGTQAEGESRAEARGDQEVRRGAAGRPFHF